MATKFITILYITNGINGAGGLERVLSIKASYLADVLKYEVHIVTLNEENQTPFYSFSPLIHFHSIKVKGNPFEYFFAYAQGINAHIQLIQPKIISVCDDGLKAFFLPLIIGKKTPLVYERHVSKEIDMKIQFSLFKKLSIRAKWKLMDILAHNFSKFIVLSKGNIKEWQHLKNLVVIPNPSSFYPSNSSDLSLKKVIAVGKQGYQKGYDRLLIAWQIVSYMHPDWSLDIYGTRDPNENLEDLIERLNIKNTVNLNPPIQDIKNKYLEASVYVMSSRYEGFGMVLIEAMACGVPCVSFDCPHGPADIITHEVDGLLVENGNVKELAQSLIRLIENEDLRKEMGQAAKNNVQRFLPETILPLWDLLFKSLIR